MGDKPGQKPAQVVEAAAEAVDKANLSPKKKKKLETRIAAAKERTKLTTNVKLAELFSGVGKLWEGFRDFLKGVFSGMKDEMPDKPETKKQKKERSKRRKTRLERMAPKTAEQHKKVAASCQEAMKKPGWNKALNTAASTYQVSPATMMAIIHVESRFDPTGYPKKTDEDGNILYGKDGKALPLSSARNLGQLLWGTPNKPQPRQNFMKKEAMYWGLNPLKKYDTPRDPVEITKEMTVDNPFVGFIQLAWLTKQNAKFLKIDAADQANAGLLYLAHHDGAGMAKMLKDNKPIPIPSTYVKNYPTYEKYREHIFENLSKKVGGTATVLASEYDRTLEAIEKTG